MHRRMNQASRGSLGSAARSYTTGPSGTRSRDQVWPWRLPEARGKAEEVIPANLLVLWDAENISTLRIGGNPRVIENTTSSTGSESFRPRTAPLVLPPSTTDQLHHTQDYNENAILATRLRTRCAKSECRANDYA